MQKEIATNLHKYITDVFKSKVFYPPLALTAIMDHVFNTDKWWAFEYETILKMLKDKGFPRPSTDLLGEIQCIASLRNNQSFIDKEWHLFEKAVAALTGIPVLFYEKQNLPIENVIHAVRIMKKLAPIHFSDEVKHYIGCEVLNDELYWYPLKKVDDYLVEAVTRIHKTIQLDMEEFNKIRKETEKAFNKYLKQDIETANFRNNNVAEIMCLTILASLEKGAQLMRAEDAALNTFLDIKNGGIYTKETEVTEDVDMSKVTPEALAENKNIVAMTEDQLDDYENEVPDSDVDYANKLAATFEEGIKASMSEKVGALMGYLQQQGISNIESPAIMSGGIEEFTFPALVENSPIEKVGAVMDFILQQALMNGAASADTPEGIVCVKEAQIQQMSGESGVVHKVQNFRQTVRTPDGTIKTSEIRLGVPEDLTENLLEGPSIDVTEKEDKEKPYVPLNPFLG